MPKLSSYPPLSSGVLLPAGESLLPFVTVGPTGTFSDYICSGTADDVQIQAAVNAIGSNAGIIFFRPGTYNITQLITQNNSNITIQGSGAGATTLKATASFSNGIFSLNGQNPTLKNVYFNDITFDCNNEVNVEAISLKGGTFSSGQAVDHIRINRCDFINLATADIGFLQIFSGRGTTDRGSVTDVVCTDCRFMDTVKYHVYVNGQSASHIKFVRCKFINSQGGCMAWNDLAKSSSNVNASIRGNQDWEIENCYFNNNGLGGVAGSCNTFQDVSRGGMLSIKIHHNLFDGFVTNVEQYVVSCHSGWDVQVHNNTFWKVRTCFAIGASNNGSYGQPNPDLAVSIKDNLFYRCYNMADHDASIFSQFEGNKIIEQTGGAIAYYARHWPSSFKNNFIYNTPTQYTDINEFNKAAIVLNPDGLDISGNTFIDDRLLPDPSTAPVLSAVSGGSLGSRTYFVKYTWANDTGETVASSESTLAVSANQLLKATIPSSVPTYSTPTGAKLVNWYVSTSSGAETYAGYSATPWEWDTETDAGVTLPAAALNWTEPSTGAPLGGVSPPVSNTTSALTLYGIYELSGAGQLPNHYENNKFLGIGTEIFKLSTAKRVQKNNFTNRTLSNTGEQLLEAIPFAQGNVTGLTTFNIGNGEIITATFTGNTTATLSNGHYIGQLLERRFTMGGSGGYTYTRASNEKLAGGGYTPSSSVGTIDILTLRWDGTNWNEISRALNVS